MRCLEKRPADRWQRVEEMLPHLESFAIPSGGITPAQNGPAAVKRALPIWVKAAIPAVAGAVVAVLWMGLGSSGTDVETAGAEALVSGEARRLIVVPLENLTGDPEVDVWSELSAEWIGRAIDQPRPVDVVPASAVRDAIKAQGADASVTALAERLGARWAVAGSLARTGEQVRFEVEFREVASGERLRSLDPVVGPVDSIEAVVGRLANLAAAAAVTLLDPGAPPWYSTISLAPSVQLFRDYLVQGELFCQGQELESIQAGDRVLEQAPDFIPALLLLRVAHSNLNRNLEADSLTQLLERLRDRMTAAEVAEQDWMWGMRGADALYRFDPTGAGANKAGLTYQRANRLQGALDRFLTMDLEAPCVRDWEPWWINTANTYHLLGRFEEELQLSRRGLERFPEARRLLDRELSALAALGRVEAVDSVLEFIDNLPPAPGDGSRAEGASLELRAHGHREAAEATARRAVEWYADAPAVERPAFGAALYAAGRWSDVDTLFASLLLTAPENVTYLRRRGVALARLGRREEALEMSRRLELLVGRPNVRGNHFAGQSEIAAALGERDEAVRLLRRAFDVGYAYSIAIHQQPAYDGMWGYAPWENLVRPRP
jgi:tetratricopeptide (TPR) repeat protein/TolB-like protein